MSAFLRVGLLSHAGWVKTLALRRRLKPPLSKAVVVYLAVASLNCNSGLLLERKNAKQIIQIT
jgi:hypothetical protein